MSNLTLFFIEIVLCSSLSMAVILLLKSHLRDVLTESCGTAKRADFWVMFAQLMLVIAPMLLVVYFTDIGPGRPTYPPEAIKDTLFSSLLGFFLAVTTIGQVIWRSAANGLESRDTSENDKPAPGED